MQCVGIEDVAILPETIPGERHGRFPDCEKIE